MSDERSVERVSLIYHLRVFDPAVEQVVGYVDDISIKGARILSEYPLPSRVTNYRLELPFHHQGKRSVDLNAVTAWSNSENGVEGFIDTGVRFVDLCPMDQERLSRLIGGYHL